MRNLGVLSILTLASAVACSGAQNGSEFANDGGGTGTGTGTGTGGGSSSGGGTGTSSGGISIGSGNLSDAGGSTSSTADGGFVCSPNPLNYDIPGNGCDDDGDGTVDNHITCDTGAVPAGLSAAGTAADFAAAIELCQVADATHWGVVSATYTNGHTQTSAGPNNFGEQHGVLQTFGSVIVPREGASFGGLSSGSATAEDSDFIADGMDANGAFKGEKNGMQTSPTNPFGALTGNSGDVPSGFPQAAKGCPGSTTVNDVIDVKLQVKVPANANGLTFDFNFFSGEWPDWVCTEYNDSFIAYLQSSATTANISFDSQGNPVSVNNGFFGACSPANAVTGCQGNTTGTDACSLGAAQLAGTGFDNPGMWCTGTASGGGATGWLTSQAPVTPGETITLEFIIWDTEDWNYDSSVLIDNMFWKPAAQPPPTVVTAPSPPK